LFSFRAVYIRRKSLQTLYHISKRIAIGLKILLPEKAPTVGLLNIHHAPRSAEPLPSAPTQNKHHICLVGQGSPHGIPFRVFRTEPQKVLLKNFLKVLEEQEPFSKGSRSPKAVPPLRIKQSAPPHPRMP
jgi:hypothetical protein